MDQYTAQTKEWLNTRFRKTTEGGVFFAHQNIYGFKSPFCEEGVVLRYVIFLNVIKALQMLKFESFLDVGGAEGYMSAVIRKIFNAKVRSCDLSDEACNRAREIFQVEADPVDGVALPYPDESFDVVLSSESLEHIPQYEVVLKELLRVARKAVIVTVPHDGPEAIEANIRNKVPHGHLHDFTLESLQPLVPPACEIKAWGHYSSILRLPYRLIEGRPVEVGSRIGVKRFLVRYLNPFIIGFGKIMNRRAFKFLFAMDSFFADRLKTYRQLVFVIAKDPSVWAGPQKSVVDVDSVLDFKVPLYVLK